MRGYLEVWLRGFAKDHLRHLSGQSERYHPHITLVRPFETEQEEVIRKKVATFCSGKSPLPFTLEGKSSFNQDVYYVPVVDCEELLQFSEDLESDLEHVVELAPKLGEKVLHATLASSQAPLCERMEQYMLRVTGIRERKIWFSYDLVTQELLDREESLDKERWCETVRRFSKQSGFTLTRDGDCSFEL